MLLIGLWWLHPQMDKMITGEGIKIRVSERAEFYQLHRVYLWGSTIQWAFGWIWLIAISMRLQPIKARSKPSLIDSKDD